MGVPHVLVRLFKRSLAQMNAQVCQEAGLAGLRGLLAVQNASNIAGGPVQILNQFKEAIIAKASICKVATAPMDSVKVPDNS